MTYQNAYHRYTAGFLAAVNGDAKEAAETGTNEKATIQGKAPALYAEDNKPSPDAQNAAKPADLLSPAVRARAAEVRTGVLKRQFKSPPTPQYEERVVPLAPHRQLSQLVDP